MENTGLKIGDIRRLCQKHFEQSGSKLTFRQAYQLACRKPHQSSSFLTEPPSDGRFLPEEEFAAYIDTIPLQKTEQPFPVPSKASGSEHPVNFHIAENDVICKADDITVYIHIPFINDGLHTHDHFEINYVYRGTGIFQFMGHDYREIEVKEGALCFLAPNAPHNFMADKDSLILSIMIRKSTFDSSFSFVLKREDPLSSFFCNSIYRQNYPNYFMFSTNNEKRLRQYMQELFYEYNCGDIYRNANAISITTLIFTYILRNYPDYASCYNFTDISRVHLTYAMLLEYMKQNYSTVTLSDLSHTFHYSPSFLSKLIRNSAGENFSRIIQKYKLEHGKALLETTDYTIHEICDMIGYTSCNHFSRAFKKAYGEAPSECRKTIERSTGRF